MVSWWESVEFSFCYKGINFDVVMDNEKYTLKSDSKKSVSVVFRGKKHEVSSDSALECAMA